MGGVAHRNREDPLNDLLAPAHVKDMFPERSVDAIFHPADGSIETMTRDPLQDSQHQAFMDPSSKLDPLQIFSQRRTEDVLNPEFLFANGNVRLAVLDTIEPAVASFYLLVLSPPSDEVGGRQCRVISLVDGTGFAGLDLAAAVASYDPAKGLSIAIPAKRYLPETDSFGAEMLAITLNQAALRLMRPHALRHEVGGQWIRNPRENAQR